MDWFQRTSRESVVFSPNIHYLQDASTLTVVSRERNIGPGGWNVQHRQLTEHRAWQLSFLLYPSNMDPTTHSGTLETARIWIWLADETWFNMQINEIKPQRACKCWKNGKVQFRKKTPHQKMKKTYKTPRPSMAPLIPLSFFGMHPRISHRSRPRCPHSAHQGFLKFHLQGVEWRSSWWQVSNVKLHQFDFEIKSLYVSPRSISPGLLVGGFFQIMIIWYNYMI